MGPGIKLCQFLRILLLTYTSAEVYHLKIFAVSVCRLILLLRSRNFGGGRVVRWCWVNFQCRGVLLIWIIVGQGPIALAVGAGGGLFGIFFSLYPFSPLSPSLWETARYRLKYCLKGPLNPKQPTNQSRNFSKGQIL